MPAWNYRWLSSTWSKYFSGHSTWHTYVCTHISCMEFLFSGLARRKRILWFQYHHFYGFLGKVSIHSSLDEKLKYSVALSTAQKCKQVYAIHDQQNHYIRLKLDWFQLSVLSANLCSTSQARAQTSILFCRPVTGGILPLCSHLLQFLHACETVCVRILSNMLDWHDLYRYSNSMMANLNSRRVVSSDHLSSTSSTNGFWKHSLPGSSVLDSVGLQQTVSSGYTGETTVENTIVGVCGQMVQTSPSIDTTRWCSGWRIVVIGLGGMLLLNVINFQLFACCESC